MWNWNLIFCLKEIYIKYETVYSCYTIKFRWQKFVSFSNRIFNKHFLNIMRLPAQIETIWIRIIHINHTSDTYYVLKSKVSTPNDRFWPPLTNHKILKYYRTWLLNWNFPFSASKMKEKRFLLTLMYIRKIFCMEILSITGTPWKEFINSPKGSKGCRKEFYCNRVRTASVFNTF